MADSTDQLTDPTLIDRQARMRARMAHARASKGNTMQASTTTMNINGPDTPPEPEPLPEKPQPEAAPEPEPIPDLDPAESVTVPISMLRDMQREINEVKMLKTVAGGGISMDQLMLMIRELKKPDEETQAKLDDAKKRREQERTNMLDLAILEEQKKQQREANCDHRKENGRTAKVGQIHSDGMYHAICQHCQKAFEPIKPTTDMMMMGVS